MVQLKLTVYTGPGSPLPVHKSATEIWLLAGEDMLFLPFNDNEFTLDHEVFIPENIEFSVSTFYYGLYSQVRWKDRVLSDICIKMYEWSQDVLYIAEGEPVIKLRIENFLQNAS